MMPAVQIHPCGAIVAKRTPKQEIPMLPEGVELVAAPELPAEPVPVYVEPPRGNIPSPRQTLNFIRNLLQEHNLEPKNKLGQNYLIDLNMLDLLVRSAELGPADCVLEVGTGTGTLTMKLGELAGAVFTVEIDREFHRLVQPMLQQRPNVTSLQGDALDGKNVLNPKMIAG